MTKVIVIGGGLAGVEATWQLVRQGIPVELFEMRPHYSTGAHHTGFLGELVCSNSLRAVDIGNAVGLLKEEMRRLSSLVMEVALETRLPAGGALAVDRLEFAATITETLENHPLVSIRREEVQELPKKGIVVVASGPLTSTALASDIGALLGEEFLSFFDAAAPIVTKESIDLSRAFFASRYGKGEADYLNCPLTEEEYESFFTALCSAERQKLNSLDKESFFEGCMPIEHMAERGRDTMLFGPLKPVGLVDPQTGKRPFAVVQLRQDNRAGTLYNLVGFQTRLKWGEQKRVFSLIPALAKAEFVRFGVMHRNTFINSRQLLAPTLQYHQRKELFFAGQFTGVEGYVESAASGLVAGINAGRAFRGLDPLVFPINTAHGALLNYITDASLATFQPMNITFGLFPPLMNPPRDRKQRNLAYGQRALQELADFCDKNSVLTCVL
ncbi:MAG: FADH(2)-oxidizing methylenetetrahydrofolate--tRNA-(uracil(54)-C(5))-methyltransferase TrmFO [Peptococcaceae bacterium]|nr:FADH(2)-oxidizing methylenetetrahydrofolate--tRNA-(uracil(54)-C(5))-methyltransferase TrmFO [Peptococcaceae bacterium]